MLRSRRTIAVGAALGTLALAVALAACGGSGSSTSGATASATAGESTAASAGGEACGAIPSRPPADPDGVLAEFPEDVQDAYNLYPEAVSASAWAKWKPTGPGPYTIFISMGNIGDSFSDLFLPEIEKLKEGPLVDDVIAKSASLDAQTQIQQVRQAIREKTADIFVVFPLSPTADAAVMEEAGKAGIPVISPLTVAANPYVVGLNGNEELQGAELMSGLATIMGGAGSLVEMQGVPGVPASDIVLEGASDVIEGCPEIDVVGKPVGQFTSSAAKTQMLQLLAAHPQQIDGVFQVGNMAAGIIQAFQQTGREVPPIGDLGATPGALAYWNENRDSYEGVALAAPTTRIAEATATIAAGMLEGRGMRINEILQTPILITDENLEEWVDPEWTLTTPLGTAPGPEGAFYSPDYVERFFVQ